VGLLTILLWICAIGVGLIAAGAIYQAAGTAADRRRYPPPGRMVDIGGRSLHLIDRGAGGPAVVFESGISATCLNWTQVRSQVERCASACTYDRAWLGWSDPAPLPRTTLAIMDDLHALVESTQIPRPFILVGHSFGGMLVRAYAVKYPDDVAGLILVDPLSPNEWLKASPAQARMLSRGVRLARRGAVLARIGVVRASLAALMAGGRLVPQLIARLSSGRGESVISRLVGEVRKMPPETWPMVRAHWCQSKGFLGLAAYLESLPTSSAEAIAIEERSGQPGAMPITVLSAANSTPEQLEQREAWARRSPRGQHIIARKSGHWIQLDEPELVVQAIREMIGLVKPS
jgi:pimeloyl-ACP methyl ester carboxylesterase